MYKIKQRQNTECVRRGNRPTPTPLHRHARDGSHPAGRVQRAAHLRGVHPAVQDTAAQGAAQLAVRRATLPGHA